MSKFLLLLGPSGVGKSTIIRKLMARDDRFVYISPYTTRPLRDGEVDKVSISDAEMDALDAQGKLVVVNTLFGGIRYGTPRAPITNALEAGTFPVLDWPIDRLTVMREAFPGQLYCVYIVPPSLNELHRRLSLDGRDRDGKRFKSARQELETYWNNGYEGLLNLEVESRSNGIHAVAARIYTRYTQSFSE